MILWDKSRWLWLALFTAMFIIQVMGWAEHFRYHRAGFDEGALWQLLSSHMAHANWWHFVVNALGLMIVAIFFSSYLGIVRWSVVMLMSSVIIVLGVHHFHPAIQTYVGLSGVLHGLFLVGAIHERSRFPLSGSVLIILLVIKLAWERLVGPMPGSESMIGVTVLTDAHLYGAVGGMMAYVVLGFYDRAAKLI